LHLFDQRSILEFFVCPVVIMGKQAVVSLRTDAVKKLNLTSIFILKWAAKHTLGCMFRNIPQQHHEALLQICMRLT